MTFCAGSEGDRQDVHHLVGLFRSALEMDVYQPGRLPAYFCPAFALRLWLKLLPFVETVAAIRARGVLAGLP